MVTGQKSWSEPAGVELSERVKIFIERTSDSVRNKIFATIERLASQRKPSAQDQKFGSKDGVFVARINSDLRMVFMVEQSRIVIDDVLDYRRY